MYPVPLGFVFSLNHIWNKNKQIWQSDELDLVLADSGLGKDSKILLMSLDLLSH